MKSSEGSTVKFGIHLGTANPRFWSDVAEEADRLGFESLWVPEHLVIPLDATGSPHRGADHPPIPSDVPVHDALAMLSFLAGRTENIRLGTHVYNIGLRHPFVTARAATTVDVVSRGRLDLGVGASWLRAEWDAVGQDFETRGARVDESIQVCRRLWDEAVVEHHGRFYDFGPTAFEPKPVQQPLRLHIGGDGPAAMRRAATWGTGWMPMNHRLEDLPASISKLRRMAESAGRNDHIEVTVPAEVVSWTDVSAYHDTGVDRLIVRPWISSRQAKDGMRRFAAEFLR